MPSPAGSGGSRRRCRSPRLPQPAQLAGLAGAHSRRRLRRPRPGLRRAGGGARGAGPGGGPGSLPGDDDTVRPGSAGGRVLRPGEPVPVGGGRRSAQRHARALRRRALGSLQHRRHRHPRGRRLGAQRPQAAGAVLRRGRRGRRRRPPGLGDARPVRGAGRRGDLHPGRQPRRHTVPRQPRARRRVGSRCPHARRPRCHGRRHAGGRGHDRRGDRGHGARHRRRVRRAVPVGARGRARASGALLGRRARWR